MPFNVHKNIYKIFHESIIHNKDEKTSQRMARKPKIPRIEANEVPCKFIQPNRLKFKYSPIMGRICKFSPR